MNQAIRSNHQDQLEQTIFKVESELLNVTNSSPNCKSIKEENNQDEFELENISSQSRSTIYPDVTDDTDQREKSEMTNERRYPKRADHQFIDNILYEQIEDSLQSDDKDKQQKKKKAKSIRSFLGRCPLTFDGAYGISKDKHSIDFCTNKNQLRKMHLYAHFVTKHRLKSIYAKRLIEAIVNKQDSMTTILFNENEDIINPFYKIECPLQKRIRHLFGYNQKNLIRVPCQTKYVTFHNLKSHLKKLS